MGGMGYLNTHSTCNMVKPIFIPCVLKKRPLVVKPAPAPLEYKECWDTFDNWENDPNFEYKFVIKSPYCVSPVCGSNCVYPEDAYVQVSYPALMAYCTVFKFRDGTVDAKVTIDYAFFEEGRMVCDPTSLWNTDETHLGIVFRHTGAKCYAVVFRLERWDSQFRVLLDRFSYHEPTNNEEYYSAPSQEYATIADYGTWVSISAKVSDAPNGVKLEGYVEEQGEAYVMESPYIIAEEGYAGIVLGLGYYDVTQNVHIGTIDEIVIKKVR